MAGAIHAAPSAGAAAGAGAFAVLLVFDDRDDNRKNHRRDNDGRDNGRQVHENTPPFQLLGCIGLYGQDIVAVTVLARKANRHPCGIYRRAGDTALPLLGSPFGRTVDDAD